MTPDLPCPLSRPCAQCFRWLRAKASALSDSLTEFEVFSECFCLLAHPNSPCLMEAKAGGDMAYFFAWTRGRRVPGDFLTKRGSLPLGAIRQSGFNFCPPQAMRECHHSVCYFSQATERAFENQRRVEENVAPPRHSFGEVFRVSHCWTMASVSLAANLGSRCQYGSTGNELSFRFRAKRRRGIIRPGGRICGRASAARLLCDTLAMCSFMGSRSRHVFRSQARGAAARRE